MAAVGEPAPDAGWVRLILLTLALTILCSLPIFLTGALAVQMREELGFGVAALGATVALARTAGVLFATPLGQATDRLGPSATMRLAAVLAGTMAIGIALFARDWATLTLFLALGGIANVLGQTSANLSLTRAVRSDRQGIAFGMKQSALPSASLIGGLAVPLIALTLGWRWAFAFTALGATIIVFLVPPTNDRRLQASPDARNKVQSTTWMQQIRLAMFLSNSAAAALGTFVVDGGVFLGISPAAAGLLLAMGSAMAVSVRVALGSLADRRVRSPLRVASRMVLVGSGGFLLLAIGSPAAYAVGALIAFGLGWGYNGLVWLGVMRLSRATPGRATGVVLSGAMLGGLAGPSLFGLIVETFSYSAAWVSAAVWAAGGAISFELARRRIHRELGQLPPS